jgi:hypothetical protein
VAAEGEFDETILADDQSAPVAFDDETTAEEFFEE